MTNHEIKCPRCQGQGYKQYEDGRLYFRCTECGYVTLLKLLNINL